MSERMTHEQYVLSARQKAVEVSNGALSGEISVLEACLLLASLRWEVEIETTDPDFSTFVMISSEIDTLPIGSVREKWSPEALIKLEPEIQSATAWATPQVMSACKSIVHRFGA